MSVTSISSPPVRSAFADSDLRVNGYVMLANQPRGDRDSLLHFIHCIRSARPLAGANLDRAVADRYCSCGRGRLPCPVVLQPNESLVCLLFGSYVGTEHRPGFWWVNPFNSKNKMSRRLETLESGPLKVNDAVGNPIDIGAVIVWRVEDAAKALLEVASYASYVKSQSETALRRMVSVHPTIPSRPRKPTGKVNVRQMQQYRRSVCATVATRSLKPCCRRSGHAWSRSASRSSKRASRISPIRPRSQALIKPRRQAASAVVAARRMIVRGAVSIVEDALNELDRKKLADALDPERKAAMISNLLVVLVGDRGGLCL